MAWRKRDESISGIRQAHLARLGIEGTEAINDWYRRHYAAAYRIDGLEEACAMIEAHKDGPIIICGDYDADGVCATALMVLALRAYGCRDVSYRIPKRHTEGYGLAPGIVEEIAAARGGGLIVTVDNGIAAHAAVSLAKEKGFDVLLTDHHLPVRTDAGDALLPEADLVIDPWAVCGSADFCSYCGAGLAYRIAKQLLGRARSEVYLPLAAVATVADVVPLTEENYVIVRRGLELLNKEYAPKGLLALKAAKGGGPVTSTDIGFSYGPMINSPGRLYDDGAKMAVDLLIGPGETDKAMALIKVNEERKLLAKEGTEKAEGSARVIGGKLVLSCAGMEQGIVGIAAGRLSEEHGMPAIVLTPVEGDPDTLKGSARSVPGVHMKQLLDAASGAIEAYGGHEGAAGLTVRKDRLEDFETALERALLSVTLPDEEASDLYDVEIRAEGIMPALEEDALYEPFGEGNERLVYKIEGFRLDRSYRGGIRDIGTDGLTLTGAACRAVAFTGRERFKALAQFGTLDLYGHISFNWYKGKRYPQIEIMDMEPSSGEEVKEHG